jgi:DNA-binding transcriptional ArsR family regulator
MDAMKALAEPRRQEIMLLVWDGERSAGDIAAQFDITFGAVSQHLRVLRKAGLIEMRKAGNHRFYRANRQAVGPLAAWLEDLWARRLAAVAELAEQAEQEEPDNP